MLGQRREGPQVVVCQIVECSGLGLFVDGLVRVEKQGELDVAIVRVHEHVGDSKVVGLIAVRYKALEGLDEVIDRGDVLRTKHLCPQGAGRAEEQHCKQKQMDKARLHSPGGEGPHYCFDTWSPVLPKRRWRF